MKSLSVNTKYTLGMLFWMTLYAVALTCSILAIRAYSPTGALLYALAVLPALPIGGSIWVFLRSLEKMDEYLRAVMSGRFITTTGILLFVCTAWGFLENNAGAHEFSLYLVYPVFWAIFGIVGALSAIFGRQRTAP